MKWIETSLLRLACLFLAVTSFTSCEWDTSPEPEHSLYITYTISAGIASFEGPEQLMLDIQAWIKENQEIYDKKVNYSTGEASEFTKTDDDAVKKYEEFVTKFKAYLDELTLKLKSNTYGEAGNRVTAMFTVYAARTQGEDGQLKYVQIKYSYP